MYGTVARTRVKPENREKLQEELAAQDAAAVPGYVTAYLLYEKGRTLLSVFMVPGGRDAALDGGRVSYRGHEYVTHERKGYRTVSWTDGRAVYGLVSMLGYDALLECADRLRAERGEQTSL